MRTRSRLAIALGSILWLLGLSCLIVWHQIWAPVFAAPGQTTSTATPYYANDPGGSFRDDFDANEPLERREVDIVHPRHGPFAYEADAPGGGQVRLTGGALMAATRPVQDGTVSVCFSHPDGGDPAAGVFVTVFGRVQDETQPNGRNLRPYQTGYAFEWDMHDGRQRLWAGSTLLAERPAPGDSHPHTLALVMQGTALQGLVDGAVALQASDSRYQTGLVGFGGHGRLPIVFTRFELARPGQGGPKPPVDVGAPFDLTEAFNGLGDEREQDRDKETYSYGSSGKPTVYRPWYAVHGSYGQNVRRRRDGVNQVILAECFYLPLDSKHARACTVTASCGRIRLMPREQAYTPPLERGSSLPMRPWRGAMVWTTTGSSRRCGSSGRTPPARRRGSNGRGERRRAGWSSKPPG